jgi:8-amino-7-oxononanoate synthase
VLVVVVGDDRRAMECTARLLDSGVFVQGIRPPTVPEGTARLRIAVSAAHSEDDVGRLLDGIGALVRDGLISSGEGS